MQSIQFINQLQKLPLNGRDEQYDLESLIDESEEMRNSLFAIEVSVGTEEATQAMFEARNIPDDLDEAYHLAFSDVANSHALEDRYLEMVGRGERSAGSFVGTLKGKLVELRLPGHLEEEFPGHTFEIASDPTQQIWDIKAIAPDGSETLIQSKMGADTYASDVVERMQDNPEVYFAVSEEIRSKVLEDHPDLEEQFVGPDISNEEFTEETEANINLLAENLGIDVPDEVGEIVPYATEVILGIRLLYDITRVERDFEAVDFDDRKRVHAVKALLLFSRFGTAAVCTTAMAAAGTAVIPIPGLGTAGGAVAGATLASYINRKILPHTTKIVQKLASLNEDDMFYLRNKVAIDDMGSSFRQTAISINE